jgi:hypothetical protein
MTFLRRRGFLLAGAGCLGAGLAACVSEPAVKLHAARIAGVDRGGVRLDVTLAIHNDNSIDLMVRDLRITLLMGRGYAVPPVQVSPNVWLRAGTTTPIDVPVVVPWQIVRPLVLETLGSTTIPYHASGFANVTATQAFEIDIDDYVIDQNGAIARQDLVLAAARGL